MAKHFCLFLSAMLLAGGAVQAEGLANQPSQMPRLFDSVRYELPQRWAYVPYSTGQPFYMKTGFGQQDTVVQTSVGPRPFRELSWVKTGAIRAHYSDLLDTESKGYRRLLTEDRPVVIAGMGSWWLQFDPEVVLRVQSDFGRRFLGIDYGEWSWGGTAMQAAHLKRSCEEIYGIALPTNRQEAAAWWQMEWQRYFGRFQELGVPIYSFNATNLSHYEGRQGTAITGNEVGNSIECTPLQYAFCRGASRQYQIPWEIYMATNDGAGVSGFGGDNSYLFVRPDETRVVKGAQGNWEQSPYTGFTTLLMKRILYGAYMAGANAFENEGHHFLAHYDENTVLHTDPRVLVLQDQKTYLSPLGNLCQQFYDNVVAQRDRGLPYTPIGLLFDRNHGFVMQYSTSHTIGMLPYTNGDNQMRAITNAIFPWEKHRMMGSLRTSVSGPFGDVFDCITTDASAETIASYRALVLVGRIDMDDELETKLKQFVEAGGVLLMVPEQMSDALWELAGITDTGTIGSCRWYKREWDYYPFHDEHAMEYRRVELTGAELLFFSDDEFYSKRIKWPVATVNRVGLGRVIVGTPKWLMAKATTMQNLFSELLGTIVDELVPVRVYGDDVQVMFNRNRNGWVVTLINNSGSDNSGGKPNALRQDLAAGVILEPRFAYSEAVEWVTGMRLEYLSLILPPGEVRIVEIAE